MAHAPDQDTPSLDRPDRVDALIDFISPAIADILARLVRKHRPHISMGRVILVSDVLIVLVAVCWLLWVRYGGKQCLCRLQGVFGL